MTHEDKLAAITADIRNKIPRFFKIPEDMDSYQVVVHLPMLTDVFLWLRKLNDEFLIDLHGNFHLRKDGHTIFQNIHWNLSSPYLKDQSEELIEYLCNLMSK